MKVNLYLLNAEHPLLGTNQANGTFKEPEMQQFYLFLLFTNSKSPLTPSRPFPCSFTLLPHIYCIYPFLQIQRLAHVRNYKKSMTNAPLTIAPSSCFVTRDTFLTPTFDTMSPARRSKCRIIKYLFNIWICLSNWALGNMVELCIFILQ